MAGRGRGAQQRFHHDLHVDAQLHFSNGQVITQLWNGTLTQSGAAVTVRPLNWNATLALIGFLANWSATNAVPANLSCR
jgi:hypothetical protein